MNPFAKLTDEQLNALAAAIYAAEGEGAFNGADEGMERALADALRIEASGRGIKFELPWGHGTVTPDEWFGRGA